MAELTVTLRDQTTPMFVYNHPTEGGSVSLVGISHQVQPECATELREMLLGLSRRGVTIHYENVAWPTEEQLAAVPRQLRELTAQFERAYTTVSAPNPADGLILLSDVLLTEQAWENHDLTMLQVVEFLGQTEVEQFIEQANLAEQYLKLTAPMLRRVALLQHLAVATEVAHGRAALEQAFLGKHVQLAARREQVALGALDQARQANPGGEFALVWGAAHLSGLGAGLRERGFQQTEQRELTAIRVDNLPPLDGAAPLTPAALEI